MTNIIKWTEGKPFIYSSEKPFPEKGELEKYPIGRFTKKYLVDSWFSQATKTPVKEGEVLKFEKHLYEKYNNPTVIFGDLLREGAEIDRSCFTITKDYNICDGCESEVCQIDPQCYDLVAVFVPPVVDHATNPETDSFIINFCNTHKIDSNEFDHLCYHIKNNYSHANEKATGEIINFAKWVIQNVGDKSSTRKAYYWNENPNQTGWIMDDLYEHYKSLPPPPHEKQTEK